MEREKLLEQMRRCAPKVHCVTNPVTMQDMANVLLTAGGSAIMAQAEEEAAEITSFCQATLLNIGVPDPGKFRALAAAGKQAGRLGHPVVLDPVGAGASRFRREQVDALLKEVHPTVIRCNPEEARILLHFQNPERGGVESSVVLRQEEQLALASKLARAYGCTALISGSADAVSDGSRMELVTGGDPRMVRLTGSGCMLSALCALFAGAGIPAFESAAMASWIWKKSSEKAGRDTDQAQKGMGSFHRYLFDALDEICGAFAK